MDIKKVIAQFEQNQDDLTKKLDHLKRHIDDEEGLVLEFEKIDEGFFQNDKALSFLADVLHFVDREERLSSYDLTDIKTIYKLLVKYYPDNIQYQEDLIAFVYNVMDEKVETIALIDEAEQRIESKLKFLRQLRSEIENE
ncbi:MAG: hypothetical protein V4594_00565 [Bacteroidota bacterium]